MRKLVAEEGDDGDMMLMCEMVDEEDHVVKETSLVSKTEKLSKAVRCLMDNLDISHRS